jgi:hypothetical protein
MAFIAQLNRFWPVGLRKGFGIKGVADGARLIFIAHDSVASGHTVTYVRFCANIRPSGEETH